MKKLSIRDSFSGNYGNVHVGLRIGESWQWFFTLVAWIIYNWINEDSYGVYEKAGIVPAILCSCFMAIHVCLQSYWFSLMAKKFISFLFGSSKDKDKKKKE